MFGHTGDTFGYTQSFAASPDARRSVVVAVNRQTTPDIAPAVFGQLRHVFELFRVGGVRGVVAAPRM